MDEQRREYIEDGELVSEIKGTWEAVTKDAEGNAHVHTLHKESVKRRPAPAEGTDLNDLLVRRAAPTIIRPLRSSRPKRLHERQALVGGDAQFPFSDQRATALFQRAARELQPKDILLVGDMVDFPALSRFAQRKEWVGSTQKGIDEYHQFLAQVRANSPNSRITVVHGNHEQRLINSLERYLAYKTWLDTMISTLTTLTAIQTELIGLKIT